MTPPRPRRTRWSLADLTLPLVAVGLGSGYAWLVREPPPPAAVAEAPAADAAAPPAPIVPAVVLDNEPITQLIVPGQPAAPPPAEKPPADEPAAPPAADDPAAQEQPPPKAPAAPGPAEEELRQALAAVPEVSLDPPGRIDNAYNLRAALAETPDAAEELTRATPLLHRATTHLFGLPFARAGVRAAPDRADALAREGRELRDLLGRFRKPGRGQPAMTDAEADLLKLALLGPRPGRPGDRWLRPAALPALEYELQPAPAAARRVLVDVLRRVNGPAASAALARRAVFDLDHGVRAAAVEALAGRPPEQARPVFLAALAYPWVPAAEHAADALVALRDGGAVADLDRLLAGPDPGVPAPAGRGRSRGRELVKVNHARNCHLCHAPAAGPGEPVAAAVPGSPDCVRADATYLRHDFSVAQPSPGGGWERYDYLVRQVAVPGDPGDPVDSSPQRKAAARALQALTVGGP